MTFKQQLNGVPIIESRCSVLLDRNRRLLAIMVTCPETQAPSEHFALTKRKRLPPLLPTASKRHYLLAGEKRRQLGGGYVEFDQPPCQHRRRAR